MPLEVTTLATEVDSVQESLVLLVEVSTEVDLEDSTLLLNVIEVSSPHFCTRSRRLYQQE